ncbi:Arc family DNA-binding protein [Nocardia sp. NPDC019395]|uniref:FitA-like ribbon-helix-helix domain-containing protein n=1 Tax=Nocardia sp. NPDC019395 TaxID=3154686 RepID=UPI0033E0D158
MTLSVRHVPDAVYRALRTRAGNHGRSTEAEILAILEDAVTPPERARLGSILAGTGLDAELPDDDHSSPDPDAPG